MNYFITYRIVKQAFVYHFFQYRAARHAHNLPILHISTYIYFTASYSYCIFNRRLICF